MPHLLSLYVRFTELLTADAIHVGINLRQLSPDSEDT